MSEWVLLAETVNAAPSLPPAPVRVRVGGIIGTLSWAAVAYWLRRDLGVALRNLSRDDE